MELKLPLSVINRADINRVLREIAAVDDYFISARYQKLTSELSLPKITRLLTELANDNGYNLAEDAQRTELKSRLQDILKTAPALHISFAADPPPPVIERILSWFRSNVHPQTLLTIGLQPSIAAGCVLRTPNKVFDMSLRPYLARQQDYLAKLISGAAGGKP